MNTPDAFRRTSDGQAVSGFSLQGAGGMRVEVLDYGAIVRALYVPDHAGQVADVVLGYDDVAGYEQDRCYFGAVERIQLSLRREAGLKAEPGIYGFELESVMLMFGHQGTK